MSEFSLIEHIRSLFAKMPSNGFEGIGDDCATLPIGNGETLVFTSDMLNEGVHFLADRISAYDIGYKSVMVNVSDVAAMGATPVATLLSVALPKERTEEWIKEFIEGYRCASAEVGISLVGGDTTSSQSGIVISVMAIGRAPLTHIKRRSAARVGDHILVGGVLGSSAKGLRDILNGACDTDMAKIHCRPCAQVKEGVLLGGKSSVHAMMDISDGLASDLRHILRASNVGAVIDLERIPTSTTIEDALCGGEDYKLLLTVDSQNADSIVEECFIQTGSRLYDIGEIVDGCDIEWRKNNKTLEATFRGYEHF